jgi:hypothetical protein
MKGVNLYLMIEKRELHGAGGAGAALANYEPDILAESLEVVSCGINPATTASAARHAFSNGSNRCWTALHLPGFTDRRLQPHEERHLLVYSCGITAVVDRPTRLADEITPAEFVAARREFEAKSVVTRRAPSPFSANARSWRCWGNPNCRGAGFPVRLPRRWSGSCPTQAGSTGASRRARWSRPMPNSAGR